MTTIGFLYPGYSGEDDYPFMQSLMPDDVTFKVVHTSVGVDAHEVQALLDLGKSERLLEGARALRETSVQAVLWACTSGSFVFGLTGAKAQAAEIGVALGIPASSTSLAFVEAIGHLGFDRVAVAATYPSDVSHHFDRFLHDAGIRVEGVVSHDIATAELAGQLNDDEVIALAQSNNVDSAQAVLLPDTAMHTARIIERLEDTLGKPVLTANQVTAWQGLKLAQRQVSIPSLGTLFTIPSVL